MKYIYDVPECSLPIIPKGMQGDETYGLQCFKCKHHLEDGVCFFDQFFGEELEKELKKIREEG